MELCEAALAAGILPIDRSLTFAPWIYAPALWERLDRITWRHFPYAPTWRVNALNPSVVSVRASYLVPDRDTGERMTTTVLDSFMVLLAPVEPEEIVSYARERVRWFMSHEIDEALRLGDARPFDPHVGEARSPLG
jgi:hypothetical protein